MKEEEKKEALNSYKFFRILNCYFTWNGEDIMVMQFKRQHKGIYNQRHGILSWKFLWQWKLDFKKRYRKKKAEKTFETIMVAAADYVKRKKINCLTCYVMNSDIFKKTTAYYKFTPYYFEKHNLHFEYNNSYEFKNIHLLIRKGKEEEVFKFLRKVYGYSPEEQKIMYGI